MGFIGFIKTFVFFFFAALMLCSVAARYVPWLRNGGWKIRLAFVLLSLGVGYLQGLGAVQRFAETKLQEMRAQPPSSTDIGYFVGDFLPTLKMLGGNITPEMWAEVRRIAKEGAPEHAAMARKLLDGSGEPPGSK